MNVLETQSSSLHDVYSDIQELIKEMQTVRSDYVKSQSQLTMIVKELQDSKDEDIDGLKEQMETLSANLSAKIDKSLEKLHNHYHIANEDISKSVQFLAKQSQVKNGYTDLDS